MGLGSHFTPNYTVGENKLFSAASIEAHITREELERYLDTDPIPTLFDGDLVLNTDLSLDDFAG